MRTGTLDEERLEQRLLDRGLMSRLFIGRVANRIRESWQMYPLGVLFGLGFDTATRGRPARDLRRRGDEPRARSSPCSRCRCCSRPGCR